MNPLILQWRNVFRQAVDERDNKLAMPQNVEICRDISYASCGVFNLLDICIPKENFRDAPLLIHVHGGGFYTGLKNDYVCYCADMARRGFTVINFSYRIAPEYLFPAPIEDLHAVINWVVENAENYALNLHNVFFSGDSAGAQILMTYMAMTENLEYAALFGIRPNTKLKPRAVSLNFGFYDYETLVQMDDCVVAANYAGEALEEKADMLNPIAYVNSSFPKTFLVTSNGDFLRQAGENAHKIFDKIGVEHEFKLYGKPDEDTLFHVFHLDIATEEAIRCNDEESEYFFKNCC
ncbi:MAG: alpha/beta hydrolase [Clostridiales bacterium]|nr:alpha/beta hydrolase [Clostridiales bacterium]